MRKPIPYGENKVNVELKKPPISIFTQSSLLPVF